MKREFLEGLGIEKENIDKIMAENGKDIEGVKANLSTKETELATTKKLLEDADDKIASFKNLNIDEIKAEAEKHKLEAEETKLKADEDIAKLEFEHELESAIRDSKARNITAVKALLDIENLRSSTDREKDIKQAIEATKAENDYLFKDEAPTGTGGSLGNGGKGGLPIVTQEQFDEMDHIEKRDLFNKDVDLYRELAK